jgi:hypothetical protein
LTVSFTMQMQEVKRRGSAGFEGPPMPARQGSVGFVDLDDTPSSDSSTAVMGVTDVVLPGKCSPNSVAPLPIPPAGSSPKTGETRSAVNSAAGFAGGVVSVGAGGAVAAVSAVSAVVAAGGVAAAGAGGAVVAAVSGAFSRSVGEPDDPGSRQVAVEVIDYSSARLETRKGMVDADDIHADAYVGSVGMQRPEWAAVRWVNMDVDAEQPSHHRVLKHVLVDALGQHAAELALDSMLATGQRAKAHLFGEVLFIVSKIPSLPEQFNNTRALRDELDDGELEGVIEFELIVFLVNVQKGTLSTIQVQTGRAQKGRVAACVRACVRACAQQPPHLSTRAHAHARSHTHYTLHGGLRHNAPLRPLRPGRQRRGRMGRSARLHRSQRGGAPRRAQPHRGDPALEPAERGAARVRPHRRVLWGDHRPDA